MSQALQLVDIRQAFGDSPQILADVLQDGVNMSVWRRHLPPQLEDFAAVVVGLGPSLADQRVIEVDEHRAPVLADLLSEAADVEGYAAFVADVTWLVEAYTCLLGARRVGLRIRVLEGPMCPRFHVDNVPVRLLSTYSGPGSEWLESDTHTRENLSTAVVDLHRVKRLHAGEVALLKGEKWQGNEGAGLVHRSPAGPQRRLLLSLDWLA